VSTEEDPKPAPAAKPAPAVKSAPPAKAAKPDDEDVDTIPSPPPWWKTLRADPPAPVRIALGVGLIALVLLLWWFVTRGAPTDRIISPSKLPSPGEVFGSLGKLMDRSLGDSTLDTLERVFKGIGLAAIVGIAVGVLAAANRGVNAALAPLVIFLRSVPMGALIPLTLLLFGDGEKQKWMFIFLAVVPFVFSDTVKAISVVPERYVETALTLGASRLQIVRKVLVPLALPDIITSLRFLLGLALGYIVLAEMINTPKGLGTLFTTSERQGLFEHIYLLLFVIALIAFSLDLVLRTIQRGLFAWRKDL
jgi:ABC-type nitrate/sulfonate/bicarbonate transport system permease component